MTTQVIAVFDIGKTNKKFLLFDEHFEVVHAEETRFDETVDEDGFPCEDLPKLSVWLLSTFQKAFNNPAYRISALNLSAYGASLVHIGENSKPVAPLYNYLKPFPDELATEFFAHYGPKEMLCTQTASPWLGMLNSGLQLYWLKKHKPDVFQQVKYSLHFPQYCTYLFTGKRFADVTSVGCHTMLWDFSAGKTHEWVQAEDIYSLQVPIVPTTTTQLYTYQGSPLRIGVGVHDSSAALVPYLLNTHEPFILLSTGTWCIALNPFNQEALHASELQQDCLCYLSFQHKPVKAARAFLGNEHDFQVKRLETYFQKTAGYHKQVVYDWQLLNKLIEENRADQKFYPQTTKGTGPYPGVYPDSVDLSTFASFEEAYHQLVLDLAFLQAAAIRLALGKSQIKKMFISGGFNNNKLFIKLLATLFPQIEVYSATVSKATALGAALVLDPSASGKLEFKFGLHLPDKALQVARYQLFST
jgi:sugar (pentulose or hexulose) kinase